MILFCFHSAHSIMKYIQTLLTFWSAVGFGPIFDCDIKTNNQTCKKQIKSEILLTRNLYLYVPSTISRIWCNSKTASHAMLLQWYMIIYVFPVFCKYWLISEIYLLLLRPIFGGESGVARFGISEYRTFWLFWSLARNSNFLPSFNKVSQKVYKGF